MVGNAKEAVKGAKECRRDERRLEVETVGLDPHLQFKIVSSGLYFGDSECSECIRNQNELHESFLPVH